MLAETLNQPWPSWCRDPPTLYAPPVQPQPNHIAQYNPVVAWIQLLPKRKTEFLYSWLAIVLKRHTSRCDHFYKSITALFGRS